MLILEFAWLVVSAWQECKILLSTSPKISMVVKAVSWSKSSLNTGDSVNDYISSLKRYLTEVNIYTHSIDYIPTYI